MSSENSLAQFFYNIVPGILFLWLVSSYNFIPITYPPSILLENEFGKGLILISLSLALGFLFQSFTKFFRKTFFLNGSSMNKVKNDNETLFKIAEEKIKKANGIKDMRIDSEEKITETIFYLMDDFLRGTSGSHITNHFSSMLAFWSNICMALLTFFVLRLVDAIQSSHPLQLLDITLLVLFAYSLRMFLQYLQIFYDSVLKTFVMVYKTT